MRLVQQWLTLLVIVTFQQLVPLVRALGLVRQVLASYHAEEEISVLFEYFCLTTTVFWVWVVVVVLAHGSRMSVV